MTYLILGVTCVLFGSALGAFLLGLAIVTMPNEALPRSVKKAVAPYCLTCDYGKHEARMWRERAEAAEQERDSLRPFIAKHDDARKALEETARLMDACKSIALGHHGWHEPLAKGDNDATRAVRKLRADYETVTRGTFEKAI